MHKSQNYWPKLIVMDAREEAAGSLSVVGQEHYRSLTTKDQYKKFPTKTEIKGTRVIISVALYRQGQFLFIFYANELVIQKIRSLKSFI